MEQRREEHCGAAGGRNHLAGEDAELAGRAARARLSGEVERISATVEQSRREAELAEKLAAAERELAEVKAAAAQNVLNPLRRTMPAATAEMLAKHGIGEGRWMCARSMRRCPD